jgi:hypothetical protein
VHRVIRDRRFVTVYREKGIVFAFGFFDHDSINWTWQIAGLDVIGAIARPIGCYNVKDYFGPKLKGV